MASPLMFVQQDPGLDRRRKLAEAMMAKGTSFAPVGHWTQGAARLAQALSGKYQLNQLEQEKKDKEARLQNLISSGLGMPDQTKWDDPNTPFDERMPKAPATAESLMQVLASDPSTAPYALQMKMQQIQAQQKAKLPGTKPSSLEEWEAFKAMSQQEQEQYLRMKRSNPYLNLGGRMIQPSQTTPGEELGGFEKTLPPQEEPSVKEKQAAATETGKQEAKARETWQASETKLLTSLANLKDRQEVITQSVSDAKDLLSGWSAEYGSMLSSVPASESRRLKNLLDTIRANVGFSELQAMRDSSPTGGALGQVSEMENRLLQSVIGSLDQANDIPSLVKVLDRIEAQRVAMIDRAEAAYNRDLSKYGSDYPETAPEIPGAIGPRSGGSAGEMSDEALKKSLGL